MNRHSEKRGLAEARRFVEARKGPPDDERDRPPVRPMPGRRAKVLPGQLDVYGSEQGHARR
jgi:hypothetical protein